MQLIGIIASKRRILKAPRRGTKNGLPHRFTLESPPPFYHPWLRQRLRKRARARMREEWPSQLARAIMRWEAVCETADIADEHLEAHTQKTAAALAKVKQLPGGDVVLDDAEEATPLPAGELLTLDMFHSINFKANVDRRSGGNGWTADAVKNQLKLWNLRRPHWSELEVDMFSKAGLIGDGQKVFKLSGKKPELVKRVRDVLTTQRAAEKRQAVLDKAMQRLDEEQEQERLEQEQADTAAERQSRRGRGKNRRRGGRLGGIRTAPSVLADSGVLQRLQPALGASPGHLAVSSRRAPICPTRRHSGWVYGFHTELTRLWARLW